MAMHKTLFYSEFTGQRQQDNPYKDFVKMNSFVFFTMSLQESEYSLGESDAILQTQFRNMISSPTQFFYFILYSIRHL